MKKLYDYIIIACCAGILAGCNSELDEVSTPERNGEEESAENSAILLSAPAGTEYGTKALGDFPNSGRIAVTAAYYNGGSVNWLSYADIQNTPATANQISGNYYEFTWDDVKYWPFDDSELVFMAYSPLADGSAVKMGYDPTVLQLTLQNDMPDVLYASGNETAETVPYRKSTTDTVRLGEFRHALSQVTVIVQPGENMNPAVQVASLALTTAKRNATLDLFGGDSGLTVDYQDDSFTYTLVSSAQNFDTTPISETVLVYPSTEDYATVSIRLTDGQFSLNASYDISDFENIVSGINDLSFDRAKNTILTITVNGVEVQNPDDNIVLKGTLSDWEYKGNYGVIIK
ncbi:MAG: fimbrillin family protein [Rikenellaceae bacterium]|nr:fimbrillin family protein [Rikenellaceae bacterium]